MRAAAARLVGQQPLITRVGLCIGGKGSSTRALCSTWLEGVQPARLACSGRACQCGSAAPRTTTLVPNF